MDNVQIKFKAKVGSVRSEEHTSELQSPLIISYAVFCLKNISMYTEYVKTNNFKDAYTPWMSVFTEAPKAQVSTYTNGDVYKRQPLFLSLIYIKRLKHWVWTV